MELRISNVPLQDISELEGLYKTLPSATIYQSPRFAESLKKNAIFDVSYLYVLENEKILASLILLIDKKGLVKSLFPKIQWFHGPLLLDNSKVKECYSLVFEGINTIARKNNTYAIIDVVPPYYFNDNLQNLHEYFLKNNFFADPSATFAINLKQDLDTIYSKTDKSCKKNIKNNETNDIKISKITTEDEVKEYIALLEQFRKMNNLPLPPLYPTVGLWKDLHDEYLDIFVAKKQNEIISGIGAMKFNGIIFEVAVARSNYEMENKFYPQDSLKWSIISEGKKENMNIYDLGGVSPIPNTDKEKGIYQFKKKWGGDLYSFFKYSKVQSEHKKSMFEFIKSVRDVVS